MKYTLLNSHGYYINVMGKVQVANSLSEARSWIENLGFPYKIVEAPEDIYTTKATEEVCSRDSL